MEISKVKGTAPIPRREAKFKVTLKLLNTYGDQTTLMKFDPKKREWIVFCSYYPHITFFVEECYKRRVRFKLDQRGFQARFKADYSWLKWLPYYGRHKWRVSDVPIEVKREIMAWVNEHKKRYGKDAPPEAKEALRIKIRAAREAAKSRSKDSA